MRPFGADGVFCAGVDGAVLRRAAVRGASVTIFAQGASLAVQITATVVLARLLLPADFGVVAMVTTFSLLFASFGLNGFTEAILQREQVTRFLASNLFWINLGAGALLTGTFIALAPWMARFYHDPAVTRIAQAVAATILLGSLVVLHQALLQRAMRFTAVGVNAIVARAASVIVSIACALGGWGYWALVAGMIAQPLSQCLGVWLLCRWIPSWPRREPGTGAAVKFALNVYSHFGFNYSARNTDNLLVGWQFNAQALGFYKKAYDLFALPVGQLVSPVGAVAIATLSRFNRDRAQYERYFLRGISVLALVGMGVGADFTLIGKDLIRFLLGPGWDEAGRIFAFFGPGIGVMLLYNTHGWIHLSIGRPDRWFRWGVLEFLFTAGLFVLALPWGPEAIALAWTVSFFALMIPAFWYAGRPIGFRARPVIAAVWRYFVASAVAGEAAFLLLAKLQWLATAAGAFGALARVLLASLVFCAFYVGMVGALHGGFAPFRQLGELLRELLPARSGARPALVRPALAGHAVAEARVSSDR